MRIYLDVCCLCRPFDDQSLVRVHLESEAVLSILSLIETGKYKLVSSDAIYYEIENILVQEKRRKVEMFLPLAHNRIESNLRIEKRAEHLIHFGLRALDALHIACAEEGGSDVFLTTDGHIIKKAKQLKFKLEVANPVDWLMEVNNK